MGKSRKRQIHRCANHERHYGRTSPRAVFRRRQMVFSETSWKLIEQIKAYAGDPEIPASILGRNNLPANPHFVRWPIPEAEVINMGAENFPQNIGYK